MNFSEQENKLIEVLNETPLSGRADRLRNQLVNELTLPKKERNKNEC